MEHLERVQHGNNWKWKHPPKPDCLYQYPASTVNCNVDGEWDVSNEKTTTFLMRKYTAISLKIQ